MLVDPWLPAAAAAHPDRVAVRFARGAINYRDLDSAARDLAHRAAGDVRVALPAVPGPEFVNALHGCLRAGVAAVPIDPRLTDHEAGDIRAGTVVAADAFALPNIRGLPPTHPGATIATVMHTSGTTTRPRAVPLTHGNWHAAALGTRAALGLGEQERWLCALPLAHVGGLSILIRCAVFGWTAVLHERFEATAVKDALMDGDATVVSLVPTMLARLLDAGLARPPALRVALVGGAPLPAPLAQRARAAGVPVAATYGLTETCSQATTARPGDPPGDAGVPLPGVDVRVGQDGQIHVRGDSVSAPTLSSDGWLHTGDLGELDAGGRLRVSGRASEMIVTGGENVAPAEVEAVLLAHRAVGDAAVHAWPDSEWGEAVVASVVLVAGREPPTLEDLQEHCAQRLARFKVPKEIMFVSELPRTTSGKLRRGGL